MISMKGRLTLGFVAAMVAFPLATIAGGRSVAAPGLPELAVPVAPEAAASPAAPAPSARDQWSLKVHVRDADADEIVEMARRLTEAKLQPPPLRINHYRAINVPGQYRLVGWSGSIAKIEEVPRGELVTLTVSADLERACDSYFYYEQYLVTDRGIRFVGATTPKMTTRRFICN